MATPPGGLPFGLGDVGHAPGQWYYSRELVPFMPERIRSPHRCGYVLKRAFDYGLILREELSTRGRIEYYNPVPHIRCCALFRRIVTG
jgi:hypothetical protein